MVGLWIHSILILQYKWVQGERQWRTRSFPCFPLSSFSEFIFCLIDNEGKYCLFIRIGWKKVVFLDDTVCPYDLPCIGCIQWNKNEVPVIFYFGNPNNRIEWNRKLHISLKPYCCCVQKCTGVGQIHFLRG